MSWKHICHDCKFAGCLRAEYRVFKHRVFKYVVFLYVVF